MKISKKAARQLGADLATELNKQRTIEARVGVLAARSVIFDQLDYPIQSELMDSFNKKLDELEPLSSPRRGWL